MDEGLVLEEWLPVAIESLADFPDDFDLARLNGANEWFLKAHFVLEEAQDFDEHDAVQLELRRLDMKLNLMIEMLGELLARESGLPASTAVRLTPRALVCESTAFRPGDRVLVSLFINPLIPKPLRLPGQVESMEDGRVTVVFQGLAQGAVEALEKLIFRHHRKTVAQSRSRAD